MKSWIGVDLDATLAEYHGWKGSNVIGEPIPVMVDRVKKWLTEGTEVKIVTARISHDGTPQRQRDAAIATLAIMEWCELHIGCLLPVTNQKDFGMIQLWDDRVISVIPNTGEILKSQEIAVL